MKTIQREIQNELLLVTSEKVTVTIPSAECILGDKLTAFAPHTTGIPVGIGKSLEIAKQLFDVATLTDILFDYNSLKATYDNAVTDELAYRGLAIGRHEVLTDTINTCISIISRGILNKEDFPEYLKGIQAVASHIISYKYSGEIAAHQACKVLYLATVLLKEKDFTRITTPETYIHESIANTEYKKLSWIRKQNLEAYGYLYEAIKLLSEK